jgi:hypothetical protein
MRNSVPSAAAVALTLLVSGPPALASAAAKQNPPPAGAALLQPRANTSQSQAPPASPASEAHDLNKIKSALSAPSPLKLGEDQLRFYVRVIARQPRFADFIEGYDLKYGPVAGAPMTHQEFLNMVTPRELYGSGGITASDLLQFSITNWLAQAIIRKGIDAIRDARSDAEIRAIRQRIDRELAALAGRFDED